MGWITLRHNLVSPGYGWLVRSVFGGLALIGAVVGVANDFVPVREAGGFALLAIAVLGIVLSIQKPRYKSLPFIDMAASLAGLVGIAAASVHAGGPLALSVARLIAGALLMGGLTSTMLLGHWYLVQPGLSRKPLWEQIYWVLGLWFVELAVFLWPTGLVDVLANRIEVEIDLLGWFWLACTGFTLILLVGSAAALREKGYQAVMAVTGLTYLALLTGFGMDIVARLALN